MIENLLPFLVFFPFIAGLLVYAYGRKGQKNLAPGMRKGARVLAIVCMAAECLSVLFLAMLFYNRMQADLLMLYGEAETVAISRSIGDICGFGVHFTMDGFRLIYALVAVLMWSMTTLLSGEYFEHHTHVPRFYLFLFWTMGATLGVFLSADLYTTFIFFEIMSFTSYVWVAQEENRPSLKAAETYLAVAVIGGMVMLMGIFLLYHAFGTLEIRQLQMLAKNYSDKSVIYAAGACMLVGFGAKAGAFPLHIWLPKAHPVAPAPASALLSGILTKTGIYGVLILSCNLFLHDKTWGAVILALGVITMFLGAVLAVFSIDLKRTLACSSMSQIGFILVGVGMQCLLGEENALAVHGTLLHMVNHSLIKLVLFIAAGVVFFNAHALDLNKIRGFGRKKPLLQVIFLTGALAIGGVPMFGGYISKTLLHEAIVEFGAEAGMGIITAVEWIFMFSGGLTVAYMTKLFVAVFVESNTDKDLQAKYDGQKKYMNPASTFALTFSALVLLVWGLLPGKLMNSAAALGQTFMNLEEYGEEVSYFSLGNLKGAAISILIGAAVYFLFIRLCLLRKAESGETTYVSPWPAWLDLEELLYRPLLLTILPTIFAVLCRIPDSLVDGLVVFLRKTLYKDSPLPGEAREGTAVVRGLGHVMNCFQSLYLLVHRKKAPQKKDYVRICIQRYEELKENNRIIARSLSFGLMLAGIGLILMFVYLLWM